MKELIAEPRSLYDAWVKSIIVPLTAIAEDDIKLFEQLHLKNTENLKKYFGGKKPNLVKIDFQKHDKPQQLAECARLVVHQSVGAIRGRIPRGHCGRQGSEQRQDEIVVASFSTQSHAKP